MILNVIIPNQEMQEINDKEQEERRKQVKSLLQYKAETMKRRNRLETKKKELQKLSIKGMNEERNSQLQSPEMISSVATSTTNNPQRDMHALREVNEDRNSQPQSPQMVPSVAVAIATINNEQKDIHAFIRYDEQLESKREITESGEDHPNLKELGIRVLQIKIQKRLSVDSEAIKGK